MKLSLIINLRNSKINKTTYTQATRSKAHTYIHKQTIEKKSGKKKNKKQN